MSSMELAKLFDSLRDGVLAALQQQEEKVYKLEKKLTEQDEVLACLREDMAAMKTRQACDEKDPAASIFDSGRDDVSMESTEPTTPKEEVSKEAIDLLKRVYTHAMQNVAKPEAREVPSKRGEAGEDANAFFTPVVQVGEQRVEQGTALTKWRCIHKAGLDIRPTPTFHRASGAPQLLLHEEFQVKSTRAFLQGSGYFLELADGRGWVPTAGRTATFCEELVDPDDAWAKYRRPAPKNKNSWSTPHGEVEKDNWKYRTWSDWHRSKSDNNSNYSTWSGDWHGHASDKASKDWWSSW
mmetsp:Transcript_26213/g.59133  ORF Transcript_26213/g.59133 Transcript_26213/m.59133 type:complete len:296 (+) Transcript_26213:48-935(+)